MSEPAQTVVAARPRIDPDDPVDQLRVHCRAFIESAQMTSHTRAMALAKLDEFVFWVRAGKGRG